MKRYPLPRRRLRRAFTLIELLLVLVILAVLAAVVVPKLTGRVEMARLNGTKAELSNLKNAIETFEVDNGRVPTEAEGLEALVASPGGDLQGTWNGPYINAVPIDKWGYPYVYSSADIKTFNIVSGGPDHQIGTDDDLYAQ